MKHGRLSSPEAPPSNQLENHPRRRTTKPSKSTLEVRVEFVERVKGPEKTMSAHCAVGKNGRGGHRISFFSTMAPTSACVEACVSSAALSLFKLSTVTVK